ncbi:MAG TPA: GtrA family protein [Paludibacter sp.]|nr:GtrA family protein [Paludibacter sp.]
MRKVFMNAGRWIGSAIDFFYPLFSRYFTRQFFRYGVSGVSNMMFDWVLYFLVFHFVIRQQEFHFWFVALKPHTAALFITFPVTLFTGFLLQKYVTFSSSSDLRGHIQLYRYSVVVAINLLVNYFGLKLLVEVVGLFPTPSKMAVTVFTTVFSYYSQKKFTFRTKN